MAKDRCVVANCRNRPAYVVTLTPLPEDPTTIVSVLQRWKLCAQDRDRVQGLINDAVEEVKT